MMDVRAIERAMRKAGRYTIGCLGLRRDDVILASFPRSGSTWIRFVLRNVISLEEERGEVVTFPVLDSTMPELGVSNLLRRWSYTTVPRVVKTHRRYMPLFRHNRCVLVVRDPRDVMTSYYRYVTDKVQPRFRGTFRQFVLDRKFGLPAWFEHYRSWAGRSVCVVRYESLLSDDVAGFQNLISELGLALPRELIVTAVERSRFSQVRAIEEQHGIGDRFQHGSRFTRAGKSGNWRSTFDPALLREYERLRVEYDVNWG